MPNSGFDPSSIDAQFATIIETLKNQDKRFEEKRVADTVAFEKMMAKQDLTNGRVNKLENDASYAKGKVAGIAVGCSILVTVIGWFVTH